MADPDARRRAEEALAEYDRLWGAAHATNAYGRAVVGLASALRALLAAMPGEGPAPTTLPPQSGAIGYTAKYNASCTDGLPHGDHGLTSEHTQPAPTTFCVCEKCGYYGNVPHHFSCGYEALPIPQPAPPRPAQDAVREAAERLSAHLPVWINGGVGEDRQLLYLIWDLLAALRAEDDRLRAAATYAHAVLTRLADSAHRWAGSDVPVGLVADVDAAKARLAGVLHG